MSVHRALFAIWPLWRIEGPGWLKPAIWTWWKQVGLAHRANLPYGLGGALKTLNISHTPGPFTQKNVKTYIIHYTQKPLQNGSIV